MTLKKILLCDADLLRLTEARCGARVCDPQQVERLIHTRMKSNLLLAVATLAAVSGHAETNAPVLPSKEKFHLYLMMGQSNMSGRGRVEDEDRTPHPRVLMFKTNAVWQLATEPVTHDRQPQMLGVGPGLAFGKAMAEQNPDVTIGLVPCSLGGTPLLRWQKDRDLYSNAVFRAKLAMQVGTLKGVLWHQGESDTKIGSAESYGDRLGRTIKELRADLGIPKLPFVAGQLGEFLYTRTNGNPQGAKIVNAAIARLPGEVVMTGSFTSEGLTHKGDELHFDSASEREMGRRYAREMIRLQRSSN